MSYFPTIPAATDLPSDSQSQIQTNFGTINTAFALNHVALGSGGSQGKHNFVEMPNQVATPATITGEGTLYTVSATDSQLNYVADNFATDLYQMTRTIHASYATFSTNPGWTFLPGGLLMMWGTLASSSTTSRVVNFAALGLPNFTNPVYNIQVTSQRVTADPGSSFEFYVDNTTVATTGFTILNRSGHSYGYYWMAIGK